MPTNALAETSPPRASRTERVAREWMVRFAELFGVSLDARGERFVPLWVSALADLTPGALEAACRRAMQTCKFFPKPAEIRALLDTADAKSSDLEAEQAWSELMAWVRENVFPDTGIRRGAPELDPAIEHAAKAANGVQFLEHCSEKELTFARKTFLQAFHTIQDLRQAEPLLGDREAKRILAQLGSARIRPPAAPLDGEKIEGSGLPSRHEVRSVLERIAASETKPELTDEEWEGRKRAHKRAVLEFARSRGFV